MAKHAAASIRNAGAASAGTFARFTRPNSAVQCVANSDGADYGLRTRADSAVGAASMGNRSRCLVARELALQEQRTNPNISRDQGGCIRGGVQAGPESNSGAETERRHHRDSTAACERSALP